MLRFPLNGLEWPARMRLCKRTSRIGPTRLSHIDERLSQSSWPASSRRSLKDIGVRVQKTCRTSRQMLEIAAGPHPLPEHEAKLSGLVNNVRCFAGWDARIGLVTIALDRPGSGWPQHSGGI
jgi:hypothetical protein